MQWHFSEKRPSDKTRDPIAGEFFSSDAIKNAGEALVREGIQNSLDARLNREGLARVRIYLSGERGALSAADMGRWTKDAWPHLQAARNGLQPGAVSPTMSCDYLVFEDFGTTGLVGDPEAIEPIEGENNAFFYFFRAEGKTEKSGDDRGRWGIGKQVFPRSSRAQMYFGYTETELGSLLMGGCVLKHHKAQGTMYKPDGYFGIQREVRGDQLTVPARDLAVIESFRRDFNLRRSPGERGLSIVVPWLDENRDESRPTSAFDRDALGLAVLDGYFVPILEGRLEVTVEDEAGSHRLARDTYEEVLDAINAATEDKKVRSSIERLRAYIDVATVARDGLAKDFHLPNCPVEKASWTEGMIPPTLASGLRETLDAGETVCVRATLTVRPKKSADSSDVFRCYLRKTQGFLDRPCHIREDLIISNVACAKLHGFTALIRVEQGALASLLGDSEGPAHTEWQGSSRNFKDKYTFGGMTIAFVANFASELVQRVYAASRQLDRELLNDLFHDVRPDDAKLGPMPRVGAGPKPNDSDSLAGDPDSRKAFYRLSALTDGFVLASIPGVDLRGQRLRVLAAYETTKGNPFKAYAPADFSFQDGSVRLQCEGCVTRPEQGNALLIEVVSNIFSLRASGFDINRDLIVRASTVRATEAVSEQDPVQQAM